MSTYMSDAVIRRLPGYYRHLRELEAAGVSQISSQELGKRMQSTASQIRQDINSFGGFGRQGYGYSVTALKNHIRGILGLENEHKLVIIGAGNIGSAVANYPAFSREGFRVAAIFDTDPEKVGKDLSGIPVLHVDTLEAFLDDNNIDIGVLAMPARFAQPVMDVLEKKGVSAIWNFAPTDLKHKRETIVVNAHLSESLQILSYKMANPAV